MKGKVGSSYTGKNRCNKRRTQREEGGSKKGLRKERILERKLTIYLSGGGGGMRNQKLIDRFELGRLERVTRCVGGGKGKACEKKWVEEWAGQP